MTTLQQRSGPRPGVSRRMPHTQLDQQPDPGGVVTELARRIFDRLPDGVQIAPSGISVPGARALVLDDDTPTGPPEAFLVGREFAHLHPVPDSSLHLTLTPADVEAATAAGWAEPHPAVATGQVPPTVVMVYAPRTVAEIDVVADLVYRSHRFASTPVTTITNREGR
ncbi:MAG TPA: luciferase family protein [Pseudonocardia sp.]|jgi:hypothetical protein|nr:luciferase family protein [Pseudonocardia sp.]